MMVAAVAMTLVTLAITAFQWIVVRRMFHESLSNHGTNQGRCWDCLWTAWFSCIVSVLVYIGAAVAIWRLR